MCSRYFHPRAALLPGHPQLVQLLQEEQEGLHEAAGLLLHPQAFQVPADRDRLQGCHRGVHLRGTPHLPGGQQQQGQKDIS